MNQAAANLIAVSRAHLMGVDVVDLKRLIELANDVIEHSVDGVCMSVLAEYAFHEAANPAAIIAMADEIEALRELRDAVITQREMYADTSDEDNMSGKQITAALDRVAAVASKGGGA